MSKFVAFAPPWGGEPSGKFRRIFRDFQIFFQEVSLPPRSFPKASAKVVGCFGFARGGGEDFLLGGVIGVSVRGLGGVLIWVNGVMVCGFMCFGGEREGVEAR